MRKKSHKRRAKGLFIALYGVNNIGKTTHAKRLVEKLKQLGKQAIYMKYPVYSLAPTGPLINKVLRSARAQKMNEEELQLLFVLNRYQFEPELKRLLQSGMIVVAEDYVGTGIAWGVAKGARLKELELMNKFLVQEDLGVLLDGKRTVSAKEKTHLHEQNDPLVEKCARVFRRLARKYRWKTVRVVRDPDVTAARLWKTVSPYLAQKR